MGALVRTHHGTTFLFWGVMRFKIQDSARDKLAFISKSTTLFSIPTMPATFPSTRLTATSPPNPLFPAKKSKSKKKKRPTEEERFAIGQAKRLLKRGKRSQKWEIRYQLVLSAVRSTIAILQNFGLSCAAFGSLACKLYGEFRFPEVSSLTVCVVVKSLILMLVS